MPRRLPYLRWLVALVALTPVMASAQPDAAGDHSKADKTDIPARARALAERGRAHHDAGDYTAAIAAFTEAYALAPSAALLFNLAQSYRLGGHCDDAATMYKRFLATDPPQEARALAEMNLIATEQCAEALRPVAMAPAALAPAARDPMRFDDHDRPVESTRKRDIALGLGAGGVVALGVALAFEVRAHDDASTVSDAETKGGKGSTLADTDSAGRRDAHLADAAAITGAVALVAGASLYWMSSRESHSHRVVAIVPTTTGAQVHAAWRF